MAYTNKHQSQMAYHPHTHLHQAWVGGGVVQTWAVTAARTGRGRGPVCCCSVRKSPQSMYSIDPQAPSHPSPIFGVTKRLWTAGDAATQSHIFRPIIPSFRSVGECVNLLDIGSPYFIRRFCLGIVWKKFAHIHYGT